jgi:K+-sensing histidine kinase KdpD
MADQSRKQLRRATIVFWVLLIYIIAALVWWLISLEQQNRTIHQLQKQQVVFEQEKPSDYNQKISSIENSEKRNSTKYLAEGAAFLFLIFFGAVYIYRLVRRQFQLQLQQQNFVMAVTHELKTPISIARLNLETMQKHQLDAEKQKKLMQMTIQETMRLDTLINNILISSQFDVNAYKTEKEELDFSSLVQDVVKQFGNRYPDKKIITEIQENIDLKGDPLLLKLLLSNLLENANKYADKTTPIICKLFMQKENIQLQVIDEGKGIPDDEKKKVFDKFYRVGNEQTRKTQGTGLGLYICKRIAQSHDADISVTDNVAQGSNFTVTFKG